MVELNIVAYCAAECERQGSGELSVYNMVVAWEYAREYHWKTSNDSPRNARAIDLDFIEHIGKLVEPRKNTRGYRSIPIYVGNGWDMIEKAPASRIRELLTALLEGYYGGYLVPNTDSYGIHPLTKTDEDQFYYEFENIHPFVDGNGRTGKILYNYLCGTLDNPIMPPNFWGIDNP